MSLEYGRAVSCPAGGGFFCALVELGPSSAVHFLGTLSIAFHPLFLGIGRQCLESHETDVRIKTMGRFPQKHWVISLE